MLHVSCCLLCCLHQAQAQLLVERNTVQSLTAHYEDLKAAQTHLNNSYSQQQATITRLREDLDRVSHCLASFLLLVEADSHRLATHHG